MYKKTLQFHCMKQIGFCDSDLVSRKECKGPSEGMNQGKFFAKAKHHVLNNPLKLCFLFSTQTLKFFLNGRLGHLTNLLNYLNAIQTSGSQ